MQNLTTTKHMENKITKMAELVRRYDFELLAKKSERLATYRFESCSWLLKIKTMNKLEQLHLEAIDTNMWVEGGEYEYAEKAASKSAQITQQFAIEFAKFCLNKAKDLDTHTVFCTIGSKFQEFLKTKQ